jgi:hypothetical protein
MNGVRKGSMEILILGSVATKDHWGKEGGRFSALRVIIVRSNQPITSSSSNNSYEL